MEKGSFKSSNSNYYNNNNSNNSSNNYKFNSNFNPFFFIKRNDSIELKIQKRIFNTLN